MEHTEQSIPGKSLKYYVLGLEGISFQPKDQPGTYQVFCNFDRHAMIAELMEQIYYETKEELYGSEMICQSLLDILIMRDPALPAAYYGSELLHAHDKECAQIKEYLDANYASQITLDTLTRLTHMNKYYMAHSFTKFTGLSPIQYLNRRRLEDACQLLETTDCSISEIAAQTGFSSQSYFTQIFRKFYGMTSVQYRQSK